MEATFRTSVIRQKSNIFILLRLFYFHHLADLTQFLFLSFISINFLTIAQRFSHIKHAKILNQSLCKGLNSFANSMKKITKVTSIPIILSSIPKQSVGLIRFSTEVNSPINQKLESSLTKKKKMISLKIDAQQQYDEEEQKSKRQINYYEALITSSRLKNKKFRVQLPIAAHRYKQRPSQTIYFTFEFNNHQGKIMLLDGLFDAKTQTIQSEGLQKTYKERLQMQLACLDNRRRQDFSLKK